MTAGIAALMAGVLVSLVSFSGLFVLYLSPRRLEAIVTYLVALSVGVLLGDAFIHLLPDALRRHESASAVCLATLGGVFLFFILEKVVRWRHDHTLPSGKQATGVQPWARMNLAGDAVHNFVDGILIAGSFMMDPVLGWTTTAAIILHEIPQEIGDVGVLVQGGIGPGRAVFENCLCSLTVLAGIGATLLLGELAEASLILLLPLAAGGFIYVAASDLIPALHKHNTLPIALKQILTFAVGMGFMQVVAVCETLLLQ